MSWLDRLAGALALRRGATVAPKSDITWRMSTGMTEKERHVARIIARSVPRGGTLSVSDVTRAAGVSTSVGSTALSKLVMAGVIAVVGAGVRGTDVTILNPAEWEQVAHYKEGG